MPSEAIAHITPEPDSDHLEFYRTRDDMVRAYQPGTAEERLLVTQITRAWIQLQRFYEFQAQVLSRKSLCELFDTDLERYKMLTRGLADAERMWRNAVTMFQQARRRREASSRESARRTADSSAGSNRPAPVPLPVPITTPAATPAPGTTIGEASGEPALHGTGPLPAPGCDPEEDAHVRSHQSDPIRTQRRTVSGERSQ